METGQIRYEVGSGSGFTTTSTTREVIVIRMMLRDERIGIDTNSCGNEEDTDSNTNHFRNVKLKIKMKN